MTSARETLNALLRHDLLPFTEKSYDTVSPGQPYLPNWHVALICWYLQDVVAGRITRLLITLPPRSLKSICCSVALPAWALGHNPHYRIICASYSNDLSVKHARDFRAVVNSDWYRRAFRGVRIDPKKDTELEVATTKGGYRLATSVGGTLTGRGCNLAIIDDPLKASDAMSEAKREFLNQWFGNTLVSRLDNKAEDAIVVVTQRLHLDDLVGHLLSKGEGWVHLNLPAIAEADERFLLGDGREFTRKLGEPLHPARESLETLAQIKRTMGGYEFAAQYQQDPLPLEGGLIKWSWFKFYDSTPQRQEGDLITQSWDTASKQAQIASYSVCTTWLQRGNDHYLLDVHRERFDYPALKQAVITLFDQFRPDAVLIEDKSSGIQLIQDLQAEGRVRPIGIKPHGEKTARMYAETAKMEAGYVWLPRCAGWLDDFKAEVLQFPRCRYDDQVDSVSQYLHYISARQMDDAPFVVIPSRFSEQWAAEYPDMWRLRPW